MSWTEGMRKPGVPAALGAALLFGAGTPLAKLLLHAVGPWLLAGLLYLGSGIGLTIYRRISRAPSVQLSRHELLWLAGAVAAGGIVGPVLLMFGLTRMPASGASLLLMGAIVAGAAVLSWPGEARLSGLAPALAVLGACFAWGIDWLAVVDCGIGVQAAAEAGILTLASQGAAHRVARTKYIGLHDGQTVRAVAHVDAVIDFSEHTRPRLLWNDTERSDEEMALSMYARPADGVLRSSRTFVLGSSARMSLTFDLAGSVLRDEKTCECTDGRRQKCPSRIRFVQGASEQEARNAGHEPCNKKA